MAGLIDMIVNNPAIVNSIVKQVGIDTNDASSIISKLAPILMGGAKSNLQSDKDSGELLKHIEDTKYAEIIDKPDSINMSDNSFIEMGNDILSNLTGSKENSREVASHVEQETGISSAIIKSVLPMLAPMIIGALTKQTAPTINEFKNQEQSSGLDGILVSLIDQDNDGSIIDDVMGMAAKFLFK